MIKNIIILLLLTSNLVRAQNVDYRIDNSDSSFEKIANAVNGFDIIGIGESAHGIKEFHAWGFSFIKYMINYNRVKAVVIEDNFSQVKKINDYVLNVDSSSNVDSLTKNLYNIWQSNELVDLLQFIRSYNMAQKDQNDLVLFAGADMQDASGIYDAYKFLKNNNISVDAVTQHDLDLVAGLGKGEKYNFKKLSKDDKERIDKSITFFRKSFDKLSEIEDLQSTKAFIYAYQNFKIVAQCYQNETAGILKWITFRNKALAENLAWVQAYVAKGKQVVFMAHNGHLASSSIRKSLKEKEIKYYPILQDFMSGSVVNNYSHQKSNISINADENMLGSYFKNQPGNIFFANFLDPNFKNSTLYIYMKKNNSIHNFGVDNSGSMKIKPGGSSAIIIYRKVTSFII